DIIRLAESAQRDLPKQGLQLDRIVQELGVDRRFDRTGRDAVYRNPERAELHRKRTRQHANSAFARAIRGKVRERELFVHGADVDNLAWTPGGFALLNEGLRGKKHPLQVDIQHGIEIAFGDVPERRVLFDAGVVDQHVEPTQRLNTARNEV